MPGRSCEFRPEGSPPDQFSIITSEVNSAYPLTLDRAAGVPGRDPARERSRSRGRGSLVGPDYGKHRGAHDELFAVQGSGLGVRPHWQRLFGAFEQLGARELEARWQEARRLFRENGVSYSGASDEAGLRPVELDPVPYLIPAEDWSR